jgi:hypothetical protein
MRPHLHDALRLAEALRRVFSLRQGRLSALMSLAALHLEDVLTVLAILAAGIALAGLLKSR